MTQSPETAVEVHPAPVDPGLPFTEFRESGLLWLVNRVVFHPRGYAMAMHFTGEGFKTCTGYRIVGDGTQPWSMGPDPTDEERDKYGAMSEDELFARIKALLP